jgi:hypothetical protein
VLFVCNTASVATDKTDIDKIYAEIAGDYEFEAPGGVSTITFFVKDGALMARDRNDEVFPVKPVKGKELAFEFTSEDGQRFEMAFSKDGNGKITRCLLAMMGMELKGTKRPEKSD